MDKFDELGNIISDMADKTSSWSRENKKKAFWISISITISSALITLLVGIQDSVPHSPENKSLVDFWFKLFVLLFGGISTVLAAWDSFYNHKQLWLNYSETRNHLRALSLEISLIPKEQRSDEELLYKYMERYNLILAESNEKWKKLRFEGETKAANNGTQVETK